MKKNHSSSPRKPRPAVETREAAGEPTPPPASTFPIVGIGASAGGLEALELFLSQVPAETGLAFVVVQHMDPTQKGLLVELLQRGTALRVVEISDRMKVEPGRVHVIPPNKDLSLLHGVLHLLEPAAPRGLRLPIDFFFRSLADDRQGLGLGVILSGMGSDGTLGLRAIKEKAGAVFVQTPSSAKFDGMPRSAIESGLADVVAPAEELPAKILAYLQHLPTGHRTTEDLMEQEQNALEKVVILLRTQAGHDFSLYKKSTIYRRIERRMGLHHLTRTTDYVRYLRENPRESALLFKELLIGVTSFFRDAPVWAQLRSEVFPALLASRPQGDILRAWTPGCSTGEEAYSLAMVFREALEEVKPSRHFSFKIFATDLDKDAVQKAREGVYPANIAADVSEERLQRFFVPEGRGYRLSKEIREMVIFAPQNLVRDPPFTKLDLLTCRNLLIYLDTVLQKKLLPLFHYSLNPGGTLLLGSAETIGLATDLFTPLPGKTRLYRRLDRAARVDLIDFPASFTTGPLGEVTPEPERRPPAPASLQSLVEQLLLQRYSPTAVLVTSQGDILYISGKTGRYLEPAAGRANWNIFAMAREGLSTTLAEAFHKAVRTKTTLQLPRVRVGTNGGTQYVDITIQPLAEPTTLAGMVLIAFTEMPEPLAGQAPGRSRRATEDKARLDTMALDLQQSYEEMQTVREEMQASQEELRSAIEELQSTNEELTTSKEEMQSMNEELQTMNHELQAKVDELTLSSSDMKNLLNSTSIATLFLDDALHIRRFTPQTTSIIKLIPGDAGRPLSDIVSELDYPALPDDAREVLRTLIYVEKQIATRDERWFTVRIMPYRTHDNRIDGLVVTFYDITTTKKLEEELRTAQDALQNRYTDQTAELGQTQDDLRTEISHRPPGTKP